MKIVTPEYIAEKQEAERRARADAEARAAAEMVLVLFMRGYETRTMGGRKYGLYNAGDIAGFSPAEAMTIVSQKTDYRYTDGTVIPDWPFARPATREDIGMTESKRRERIAADTLIAAMRSKKAGV